MIETRHLKNVVIFTNLLKKITFYKFIEKDNILPIY